MAVAKEAGNWKNFPDHIQDLIMDRLVHSLTDYKRFGTVCVSWYNAHNPCPLPEAANDDRSRDRKKKKEKNMNNMIIYGGGDKKLAFLKPGGGGGKFLAINYCRGTVVVCDDTPQGMAAIVLKLQSPVKEYGLVIKYYLQEINRPVTRSCFCAQLLANGQPAAATTKAENNKVVAVKKPKPEKTEIIIIKINPDTVDKEFKVHSVLTASGLTDKPKEDLIVDIDAVDLDNQLAAVEYVEDMYKFYKLAESSSRVDDYIGKQPKNKLYNIEKRAYLVNWLIQVHNWFELMPETLFLTVYILDRFLSIKTIKRKGELQIVGIGAMLIASKYEEIDAPEVDDFVDISEHAFTASQVLAMEKTILGKLGWTLTLPTPYVFLVRFIKASAATSGVSDQTDEMENMVFYLAELGLLHYHSIITYCPSMLAASAVYAARCTLTKTPLWTETLKLYTGYSEPQIMDCAKILVGCHIKAGPEENKLLYIKYSKPERGSVALLSPARNLLLE